MKALIAYYSRSGTTKKVAETTSTALNCDGEEIFDTKNRKGLWGWLTSGRDAVRKRLTVIKETKFDPAHYEMVILGTPDFGSRMAAAVRTYISHNRDRFKQVAFFCTAGGTNVEGLLADMDEFSVKKPLATLALTTEEVKKGTYEEKTKQFAAGLRR